MERTRKHAVAASRDSYEFRFEMEFRGNGWTIDDGVYLSGGATGAFHVSRSTSLRPWWSLLAALRARLARGQGKKSAERWPSMRARVSRMENWIVCAIDEFSTEK